MRLQVRITARDDRLLGWLYDHGVLTSDQVARALFSSLDFAQRRLLELTNRGAISRFRPNKPDGGSYPYHYVLAQLGYEHVMGQRGLGLPRRDQARRRQQSLIARPDLPHLLGTNSVFTNIAAYERAHPGTRLARWHPASAFHDPSSFYREGTSLNMFTRTLGLPRPDGHGVWIEHNRAVPFFVEYDTGTERLDVLTEKIDKYEWLVELSERWAWPVLFYLPTQLRERHFHARLAQLYPDTPPIVAATTSADYLTHTRQSPAEDVWRVFGGNHDRRRRLIDLPYIDADHDTEFHVEKQPSTGTTDAL